VGGIRASLAACLFVLLGSTAPSLSPAVASAPQGFGTAGDGAALRADQDLSSDPSRSIRAVTTPAATESSGIPAAMPAIAWAAILSGAPLVDLPQPVPNGPRDRLVSADGTLNTNVGVYADCTGVRPIDANQSDIDTCFLDRTYFIGHSPGVFTPILHLGVDSLITWYDDAAVPHRLRIVSQRDVPRSTLRLALSQPDVVAEFQTCLTADGSLDRILDAVPA